MNNNSSGSEEYRERTCFERLDHYFWPYNATNKLAESIFIPSYVFFLYRLICLTGCVVVVLYTLKVKNTKSFAYIEVWGVFTACALYFLLCLNYLWTGLWKYTHFLFELTWCIEVGITIIYWAFLYPQGEETTLTLDVLLHGGVLAGISIDYLNNTIYFYRRHLRVVLLIALVYILVNIPISLVVFSPYRQLNYQDAWTALGLVVEVIFIVLAFLTGALLDTYKYRWMQKPIDDPLVDFDDSTISEHNTEARASELT